MIINGFDSPLTDVFRLIRDVYDSSDTFSADFEEIYPSEKHLNKFISDLKLQRGSLFLVARDQGQLLGYLFVEPRRQSKLQHTADLNMGVSPYARGRGVGRSLLKAALELASLDKVIEIIYLMVRADNLTAFQLYNKLGFEKLAILSRDTKIGGEYYDGILMRKFIDTPA